jgi:hypothetical protein
MSHKLENIKHIRTILLGSPAPFPSLPYTFDIFILASDGPILLMPQGKISTKTNTPTELTIWIHNRGQAFWE